MQLKTVSAIIKGEGIAGSVSFRPYLSGAWVSAKISGLPDGFHGFHLHAGGVCDAHTGFASAMAHYNPTDSKHPQHAGDFPALLSSGGLAEMAFYTGRLTPDEAVGKAVIVHAAPDDFRTDPSGNSGDRIACGVVR